MSSWPIWPSPANSADQLGARRHSSPTAHGQPPTLRREIKVDRLAGRRGLHEILVGTNPLEADVFWIEAKSIGLLLHQRDHLVHRHQTPQSKAAVAFGGCKSFGLRSKSDLLEQDAEVPKIQRLCGWKVPSQRPAPKAEPATTTTTFRPRSHVARPPGRQNRRLRKPHPSAHPRAARVAHAAVARPLIRSGNGRPAGSASASWWGCTPGSPRWSARQTCRSVACWPCRSQPP